MSNFADNSITNAGSLLISKALAGAQIEFTKVVLGDGHMPAAQTPATMTAVVSPRVAAPISKCSLTEDGHAVVGARYSNESGGGGFEWRELGLYADDPDSGEVLFSYGYVEDGEWIPNSDSTLIEKLIDVITYVGDAADVTATFAPQFEVDIDRITEAEIDEMWGEAGTAVPPESVFVPMTDGEVDGLFDDEEEGAPDGD